MHIRPSSLLLGLGFAFASIATSWGQATVQLDLKAPRKAIPHNFLGLSFETSATLPDASGHYPYFSDTNQALIQLFKTLGIKSLRIGGNTSDRPSVPVPKEQDIDQVFHFSRRAGTTVIYTLRLRDSTPLTVQQSAKYIVDRYPDLVDCLVVGNEPNVYEHTYPHYAEDLRAFYPAVLAVAPKAKLCGPSTTPGAGVWVNGYINDFGTLPQVYQVTQHAYPGGNSRKVADPAEARALMLSPKFVSSYQHLYDIFVPTAKAVSIGYRLEETNSFYNGGAKNVSNTFASSLWALRYLYWWLAHDAQGINFHTGDQVAAGEVQTPCWYATFWNTPTGLDVHPIGYAMAAFHLADSGRLVPAILTDAPEGVETYATVNLNGDIFVSLIDSNAGDVAKPVSVKLPLPAGYTQLSQMTLAAPGSDLSATTGVTLGGSVIHPDGRWAGKWSSVVIDRKHLVANFALSPASAVVLRLSKEK